MGALQKQKVWGQVFKQGLKMDSSESLFLRTPLFLVCHIVTLNFDAQCYINISSAT
jgi:hypothetical protein